jgi:hypothetical protein
MIKSMDNERDSSDENIFFFFYIKSKPFLAWQKKKKKKIEYKQSLFRDINYVSRIYNKRVTPINNNTKATG